MQATSLAQHQMHRLSRRPPERKRKRRPCLHMLGCMQLVLHATQAPKQSSDRVQSFLQAWTRRHRFLRLGIPQPRKVLTRPQNPQSRSLGTRPQKPQSRNLGKSRWMSRWSSSRRIPKFSPRPRKSWSRPSSRSVPRPRLSSKVRKPRNRIAKCLPCQEPAQDFTFSPPPQSWTPRRRPSLNKKRRLTTPRKPRQQLWWRARRSWTPASTSSTQPARMPRWTALSSS